MFISSILGVNSGLSYALLVSTFTAYLKDANVGLELIGILSLRTIPYSFKFLWSPLVDSLHINFFPRSFGQNKSWLITMQFCLVVSIVIMALVDIETNLYLACFVALVAAFFAATYDIAMESYRIELNKASEINGVNSFVVLGFRLGFIISGGFALYLSDFIAWKWVFIAIAACNTLCMVIIFFFADSLKVKSEVISYNNIKHWFKKNVTMPFALLYRLPNFYLILLVLSFYKVSDGYLDTMLIPFLLEVGFSKGDVATIGKVIGLVAFICGTFAGSYLIKKYILLKTLFTAEFLAAITNLLFILLAPHNVNKELLTIIVCVENFCAGICNIALITYMTSLCKHQRFTATHYAILISISGLSRALFGSTSGMVVAKVGWIEFFIISTLLSLPSFMCIFLLKRNEVSIKRSII